MLSHFLLGLSLPLFQPCLGYKVRLSIIICPNILLTHLAIVLFWLRQLGVLDPIHLVGPIVRVHLIIPCPAIIPF
jgi:hypothetical protein